MSDSNHSLHLLIPGAAPTATAQMPGGQPGTQPALPLPPNLRQLLQRMAPESRVEAGVDSPAMPYETVVARANGLPDTPGRTPWAAFKTQTLGQPCAWIRPCHWDVGARQVLLSDPESLALDEAEARALCEAMAPYFLEDGITLDYRMPTAWLATGEVFRDLPTTSLDRVIDRPIAPGIFDTATPAGALLARLQNEMQMLLYTHPANDLRAQRGLPPVNAFWVGGAGVLDALPAAPRGLSIEPRLHGPALRNDAAAHAAAWQAVDGDRIAALLQQLRQGQSQDLRLTLAGERAAVTFSVAKHGAIRSFLNRFSSKTTENLWNTL